MLRIRWRGLRTRIIAWSLIPSTIVLFAAIIVNFYAYQRVTEDLVTGRNRELARLSAGQLAASQSEYTDLLASLARTAAIYRGDASQQVDALRRARNRLVVFDGGVIILDSHGRVVAADPERPEVIGADWSDRSYYRQMLRSPRPAYSNVLTDGPASAEVIALAVPITGEQGEFQGVLAGMFRLGATSVSSFYGGMAKLHTVNDAVMYVVDGAGRLVYHSDPELVGSGLAAQPVVREVLSGKVGNLRTIDANGQDVVAAFAPVPGTPWGLIIQESWASLIGYSQGYTQLLLLLLVLGLLAPTLVVAAGTKRITRPIADLIKASHDVAHGKFGQTISVATGDELEELAVHFNKMSAELHQSYADLERRIADRTRELSTLNAIAGVVSRTLDLEDIMRDALSKTLEVTGIPAGGAFRLDENCKELMLVAHQGINDATARYVAKLPLDAGAGGPASAKGQPVVMLVSEFPDARLKDLLVEQGFRMVVSVPLLAKGKAMGVLNLATGDLRDVGPEELSLLAGIGHQVGVAVENAQLYEQAEQSAIATERSRLARDLHDAVTQTLFSASLIAEVLPRIWERNPEEGRRRLEELRQLTRGALAEMRTLLLELRPAALAEASFSDLLRQLAEATTGRARIPIDIDFDGQCSLPPDVQLALYRIAQEALNNVAKHSSAGKAEVKLVADSGRVELTVADSGRGFDPTGVSSEHLGLGIMRERAEAIGASLSIKSNIGSGTQITVVWQAH